MGHTNTILPVASPNREKAVCPNRLLATGNLFVQPAATARPAILLSNGSRGLDIDFPTGPGCEECPVIAYANQIGPCNYELGQELVAGGIASIHQSLLLKIVYAADNNPGHRPSLRRLLLKAAGISA